MRDVPRAVLAMATDRRLVRAVPGLRFAKLLGTGSGRTFTPTDADIGHWALLSSWSNLESMHDFESSALNARWRRRSCEQLRVELQPLASTGRWSGREPFSCAVPPEPEGPVAALTRARLRPILARRFWKAVPPVVEALGESPGLALSLGIGEAPLGLQGTFSIWGSATDLSAFAYGSSAHRRVIEQTRRVGWYAEELFARFAVRRINGTYAGEPVVP